jgi:hypothetical protein
MNIIEIRKKQMITVKEFYNGRYHLKTEKTFESLEQLAHSIKQNTHEHRRITLPAQNSDGSFDQRFADHFGGELSYYDEKSKKTAYIELIKDEDRKEILFSSGSLTNGYISTAAKEIFDDLKKYMKNWRCPEYSVVGYPQCF